MKEYKQFLVPDSQHLKNKLGTCCFSWIQWVIHNSLRNTHGMKKKKRSSYTWKIETFWCAKVSVFLSSAYIGFTAHLWFSFYLVSKNSARNNTIDPVTLGWGFRAAEILHGWVVSSDLFRVWVVRGVSAPQLLRAQHPCVSRMRSQDVPLDFKIVLQIVYVSYAIEAGAQKTSPG